MTDRPSPPQPMPGIPWVPDWAWINTAPFKLAQWRGHPVLVDVWNLQCHNCLQSQPWIREVEERYGPRGLKLLGIHTPEHPEDRDVNRVRAAVEAHGIRRPVVLDNGNDFWNSLGNRFWPTFYFVDRLGQMRYRHIGRVASGWPEARQAEAWLEELLGE